MCFQTRRGVVSPRTRNWTQVLRKARSALGVTLSSPRRQTWGDGWCYHCTYWTERHWEVQGGGQGVAASGACVWLRLPGLFSQASCSAGSSSPLGILRDCVFHSFLKFFDYQTGRPFPSLMCLSPSSGWIVNCPHCLSQQPPCHCLWSAFDGWGSWNAPDLMCFWVDICCCPWLHWKITGGQVSCTLLGVLEASVPCLVQKCSQVLLMSGECPLHL